MRARIIPEWQPYVSMGERREQAGRRLASVVRKGGSLDPVRITGRTIARSFWGKAWCDHLLSYSDYANRLPRGQHYVRNGSVIDLRVSPGKVEALVSGSMIYVVRVSIRPLARTSWSRLVKRCAGSIGSVVGLLRGNLPPAVMELIARPEGGLFPAPPAISMTCSCPDWAVMCKHVAAVLYGIGSRLDKKPELLFLLRGVDHTELIAAVPAALAKAPGPTGRKRRVLDGGRLQAVFGVDLEETEKPQKAAARKQSKVVPRPGRARRSSQRGIRADK